MPDSGKFKDLYLAKLLDFIFNQVSRCFDWRNTPPVRVHSRTCGAAVLSLRKP